MELYGNSTFYAAGDGGGVTNGHDELQPTPITISPKPTWQSLLDANGNFTHQRSNTSDVTSPVARALFDNARELTPDEPLSESFLLEHIQTYRMGKRLNGLWAVRADNGSTLASVAVNLQINLDNPTLVYISGKYFVLWLSSSATELTKKMELAKKRVETGETKFATQEQQDVFFERLEDEKKEIGLLVGYAHRLSAATTDYALAHLPHSDNYLNLLSYFPVYFKQIPDYKQKEIIAALRKNDYDHAYSIFSPYLPVNREE